MVYKDFRARISLEKVKMFSIGKKDLSLLHQIIISDPHEPESIFFFHPQKSLIML
jgi:hypothetical protein